MNSDGRLAVEAWVFMRGMTGNCAVLLAAGVVLSSMWIASYDRAIEVRLPVRAGGCGVTLSSYRGLIQISLIAHFPTGRGPMVRCGDGRDEVRAACWDDLTWNDSLAGFSYDEGMIYLREEGGVSQMYRSFTLPLWFGTLISVGALVCGARRRWVESRRRALGQCVECGYDLRGLKIDCPACAALRPPATSSHMPVGAH
jgi:hypothetical protein